MNANVKIAASNRYERVVETSKRVRWDIDKGRHPGAQLRHRAKVSTGRVVAGGDSRRSRADEKRLVSQIQGWTYANMFGLVERFINAKVLEVSHDHWFGDQMTLEALVRFSDEELKHQALFRRIHAHDWRGSAPWLRFRYGSERVWHAVLGKSTWAVLALTLHIELFTQLHYRQSIEMMPAFRSCSRTCSCFTGGKSASTRSSTSWSGSAMTLN